MTEQITFTADLTDSDVQAISERFEQNAKSEMPTIRAALILLARSSEQIKLTGLEDADAFMDLVECVTDAIGRRRDEIDLLETALARLFALLQPFAEEGSQ